MIVPHISRSDKRFIFAHANRIARLDGRARQFNGTIHIPKQARNQWSRRIHNPPHLQWQSHLTLERVTTKLA